MESGPVRYAAKAARTLRLIAVAAIAVIVLSLSAAAGAAEFDPELIISNENMRAVDSMSAADIQAFLDAQPGPLKSLVTTDHAGMRKTAAVIIYEACRAWNISPKVMLTMLQKEQSLLTRTWLAKNTLSRAIGAGCPNATTNRYPGFGNQMWHGARLLDSYGEGKGGSTIPLYYEGIARKDIYRKPNVTIYPRNLATYKLFVYNPSIGASAPYGDLSSQAGKTTGNANFWLIYRRYFGSTVASPRMRPIYRFRNRSNGTYLYTASTSERYRLVAMSAKTWSFEGAAFSWDTSVSASDTQPVHRFYNKVTRKYSFTRSAEKYRARTSALGKVVWSYGGVAFRASGTPSAGAVTVWRFRNRQTGGYLFTASATTKARFTSSSTYRRTWSYEGVQFYLPRYSEPGTATP